MPIDDELVRALRAHYKDHGTLQRVFGYAWAAFREAIERAGIALPDGQMGVVIDPSSLSGSN